MYKKEEILDLIRISKSNVAEKFEAENKLWTYQNEAKFYEFLSDCILDPSVSEENSASFAGLYRKLFVTRWKESFSTNNGLSDELKSIFHATYYKLLFNPSISVDTKVQLIKLMEDVHEKHMLEIWLFDDLLSKYPMHNELVLEVLIAGAKYFSNGSYESFCQEVTSPILTKCAQMIFEDCKKFANDLPNSRNSLTLLAVFCGTMVFKEVTVKIEDKMQELMDILKQVVHTPLDDSLTECQKDEMIHLKSVIFKLWETWKYDKTDIITKNGNSLLNLSIQFIRDMPQDARYDMLFKRATKLVYTLFSFKWESLNMTEEMFEQVFNTFILALSRTSDGEGDYCQTHPKQYVSEILKEDHSLFQSKSTSLRRTAFFNMINELVSQRETIAPIVNATIQKYMVTLNKLIDSDDIYVADFHWNLMTSLNQHGHDCYYDNKDMPRFLKIDYKPFMDRAFFIITNPQNYHPLIQCDVLKFIYLTRKHFPADFHKKLLDPLTRLLISPHTTIRLVSAFTLRNIVWGKMDNNKYVVTKKEILKHLPVFIEYVTDSLNLPETSFNHYAIEIIQHSLSILKLKSMLHLDLLFTFFNGECLKIIEFTETDDDKHEQCVYNCIGNLCLLCAHVTNKQGSDGNSSSSGDGNDLVKKFEDVFLPTFQKVLLHSKHGKSSLYVYYISINTLLSYKLHPDTLSRTNQSTPPTLSQPYEFIIHSFLESPLWWIEGNIEHLIAILQAYVVMHLKSLLPSYPGQLETVFGIAERLLVSHHLAYNGIIIFMSVIEILDKDQLEPHLQKIVQSLLVTYENNKDDDYMRGLFVALCWLIIKYDDAKKIMNLCVNFKQGIFLDLCKQVFIPLATKLPVVSDRNIGITGMCRMVECMASEVSADVREDVDLWIRMMTSLVNMLETMHSDLYRDVCSRATYHRLENYALDYDYFNDLRVGRDLVHESDNLDAGPAMVAHMLKKVFQQFPHLASSPLYETIDVDVGIKITLKEFNKTHKCADIPHLVVPDREDMDDTNYSDEGEGCGFIEPADSDDEDEDGPDGNRGDEDRNSDDDDDNAMQH